MIKYSKTVLKVIISVLAVLNLALFLIAYPEMYQPTSPTLARDFSAYYEAAWRLMHNPSQVYSWGPQVGDYAILPKVADFKYTPSFLFLVLPFLVLDYQDAMIAFNLLQLLLIPILAFFVYKLVEDKKPVLAVACSMIILIQPLPKIIIGADLPPSIDFNPFSSYYGGWINGNAHILQTVLLIGAIYFLAFRKPLWSALLFSFGLLDPRMGLLATPLLLWHAFKNRQLKRFIFYSFFFTAIENIPFLFYFNIGQSFISTNFNWFVASQFFHYEWILIYSVLALSISEIMAAKNHG